MISPEERLRVFQAENHITTKGPLSLVVQFTRMVRDKAFPLNPDDFQTSSKGQVAGLGGANLKKILKEHGITQQLSSEGGRTSRGSMGLMIKYVDFLNAWNAEESVDFSVVEDFWAEQVREYFRNQPFVLTADTSKTIGANLDDLFEQAKKRQKQNPGTQYLGTVLQHLVAAKLCLILPEGSFEIHGASVADGPTDRNGDFVIGNTVIHCTTMPGALLIEKCKANLRAVATPSSSRFSSAYIPLSILPRTPVWPGALKCGTFSSSCPLTSTSTVSLTRPRETPRSPVSLTDTIKSCWRRKPIPAFA